MSRPRLPPRRATRLALRGQARLLAAVSATVLFVALAIDLADTLDAALAQQSATGERDTLLRYLLYRSADIVLRQMPIIVLITGFIAEALRIRSGEATVFSAAGATLAPAVAAVLILAIALGVVQAGLEARWRPAAVWAQVDLGLGSYARRFGVQWSGPQWLTLAEGALRAEVLMGAEPRLREIIYLPPNAAPMPGGAITMIEAPLATPAPTGNTGNTGWVFQDATLWIGAPPERAAFHEVLPVTLDLDPVAMRYLNVPAFYHEPQVLAHLSVHSPSADIATANWRRGLAAALPGAYLLLGVTLAAVSVPVRGIRIVPLLAALFVAYLSTVSLRAFWALGEMGALPAGLAVATPLAMVWIIGAVLILRLRWRGPAG